MSYYPPWHQNASGKKTTKKKAAKKKVAKKVARKKAKKKRGPGMEYSYTP